MQKADLTILIVDDDPTLGKAMKEAFSRAGYKVMHVMKPDEAIAIAKLQLVHVAIVDCMLPKMNGRNLAKILRDEAGSNMLLYFMSGIYKDKAFIREATQATSANGFFIKPFDLPDFLQEIESKLGNMVDLPLAPLQGLLAKPETTARDRIKAINETGEIHAFDLPWVCSALMHQQIKGHLNIISADGEVASVGFDGGKIVQVVQDDTKSYLGVLMIEHGFISKEDFEEQMEIASRDTGPRKMIGERLVDANVLSPHAVELVMSEQQGIRLSKIVNETSVKVNFSEAQDVRHNAIISKTIYTNLLNEWLTSKIGLAWLKSHYMPWMRFSVKKGPEYSPHHHCMTIPTVMKVPGLIRLLEEHSTLEQALLACQSPEEHVYRALHALLITGVLRFGEPTKTKTTDFKGLKNRLTKLLHTLDDQTHFERLGVSPKAKDVEIKRAYHELAKILHPDKLGPETPNDVRELGKKAFAFISSAYETLADQASKEQYLLELEKGRAESILEAERYTEEAQILLSKGDVRKAKELIETAMKLAPPTNETKMLYMWARIKAAGSEKVEGLHQQVLEELAQIPPEDRHSPMYFFVKGLHQKLAGDFDAAKKNLSHAVSMAPEFIDARRELSFMASSNNNAKTDLLRGDLKDVVGLLFKKKK